ncbi:hypothetical protein CWR48_06165 [Oceanobacillus arenosus]|uniref:Uncharacterized protein n=1 Tax=Oceanobacillus arenosus TaxID=1229153 RepID=A0A3D8PZX3_9BACI|nr:hypothetical protein [Oceanobacillus arenosus]RDW20275.1 hypothetical protein CWR48_06165 [Oceanobacillus arenosus]
MNNWWNIIYFVLIALISIFTGEIVTFIMLGFILLTLNNINTTLKKIYKQNSQKNDKEEIGQ